MPNVTSYWLMKAVNCIEDPEKTTQTEKESVAEFFYEIIEKDYYKKINLKEKLLSIEGNIPTDSEYRKSWEKEVEFLSTDINAIKKWLESHIHLKEQYQRHYLASELLRMFKK